VEKLHGKSHLKDREADGDDNGMVDLMEMGFEDVKWKNWICSVSSGGLCY
jgi:hypothetical protein